MQQFIMGYMIQPWFIREYRIQRFIMGYIIQPWFTEYRIQCFIMGYMIQSGLIGNTGYRG